MTPTSAARRLACTSLLALGCAVLPSHAQDGADTYPNKPIRMYMGQVPGGAPDILARTLADQMSQRLGKPVVVEYKAGAAGVIAQNLLTQAPADGYNLLLATTSMMAITPHLRKTLPFDPVKDFQAVTLVGQSANVLVAGPRLKANSVAELVQQARAKPNALQFASSGIGTPAHLAGELLTVLTGTQMLHIPYKGAGQALNDLVGGTVDFMITSPAAAKSHLSGGRLKALATTGSTIDPVLPDVPLMSATVPGYELTQWWGVVVRAGTPPAIVEKIHRAATESLKDPKVVQHYKELGVIARPTSPKEFDAFIQSEGKRFQDVIRRANIPVEQ